MRSTAIWGVYIGVPLALAIVGCNTLLGIHPADDAVWDGGELGDDGGGSGSSSGSSGGSSGGGTSSSSGGASTDAQVAYQSDAVAVWANWPMPNSPGSGVPNPEAYDASSLDFVYDTVTGLTWQRTLETSVAADGGVVTLALPWAQAVAYCSNLTLDDGGWRLPARIELVSLLDVTKDPALDHTAFPDTPADEFWTSTSLAPNPASAWYVDFGFAVQIIAYDDKSAAHYIRCVR